MLTAAVKRPRLRRARNLRYPLAMDEFELQAWERELSAWQRRLDRQPPGALRTVLFEIGRELASLRHQPDERLAADVRRRFECLRSLYEHEGRDPS